MINSLWKMKSGKKFRGVLWTFLFAERDSKGDRISAKHIRVRKIEEKETKQVISYVKKVGRFLVLCPAVFISSGFRKQIWEVIKQVYGWLCRHEPIQVGIVVLAICILTIAWNSVSLYTYDQNGEPLYLGRIPLWKRGDLHVYLPNYLIQKSGTGRFFLEFDRAGRKRKKVRKLVVRIGRQKKLCRLDMDRRIVPIGS